MIEIMRVTSSIVAGFLMLTLGVRAQETLGTPGIDYPNYLSIPETSFSCSEQKYIPGFYADMETKCQVFHICFENRQESFLCPPGTVFNQAILTCDSWDNCNCSLSPQFYSVNTGPVMENAKLGIPALMKLRNLAQSKSSVLTPTDIMYEKIASLYERGTDSSRLDNTKPLSFADDIDAELSPSIAASSDPESDSSSIDDESESRLRDILSRLEMSVQNGESRDDVYHGYTAEDEADMASNLHYDPVTEQYYMEYDSPQDDWQQDPGTAMSPYDFYRTFGNKYGLELYTVGSLEGDVSEGEMSRESSGKEEFSKRMMDSTRTKRVRRKPTYTVQGDEPGVRSTTGFLSTAADSSSGEVGTGSVEERTEVPYIITDEMRIPNYRPLNTSEVPLTSDEFGQAILTELVLPGRENIEDSIDEENIDYSKLKLLASEQDQLSQGAQSDDQFAYLENVTPGSYESYSAEQNGDDVLIVKRPDSYVGIQSEETEWYRNEKTAAEESVDDTYVVIPDEFDDALDQYSETAAVDSADDYTYYSMESDDPRAVQHERDAMRVPYDYTFGFPGAYAYTRDSRYRASEDPFVREKKLPHEGYFDPVTREFRSPYVFADQISYSPPDREFRSLADGQLARYYPFDGSYAYEGPTSYADYMYGTQDGYSYETDESEPDFRDNFGTLGFDVSESEDSSTSSSLDLIPDGDLRINSEYGSESGLPWIQRDWSESSEMGAERLEVSASPVPNAEILSNSGGVGIPSANNMNTEIVSLEGDGSTKQGETYYVFDFDGDEAEVDLKASVGYPELDVSASDQLISKGSFQTEEPLQPNESLESDNNSNFEGKLTESDLLSRKVPSSKNGNKGFLFSDMDESAIESKSKLASNTWQFQTTESSVASEKPVTLSIALERLAGLQPVKAPRFSDAREIPLSRDDSRFFNGAFRESMDFGRYGVAEQQYSSTDSMKTGKEDVFSYRTGESGIPNVSKLSDLQERIRSLKQGKFGAFKKLMSSSGGKK